MIMSLWRNRFDQSLRGPSPMIILENKLTCTEEKIMWRVDRTRWYREFLFLLVNIIYPRKIIFGERTEAILTNWWLYRGSLKLTGLSVSICRFLQKKWSLFSGGFKSYQNYTRPFLKCYKLNVEPISSRYSAAEVKITQSELPNNLIWKKKKTLASTEWTFKAQPVLMICLVRWCEPLKHQRIFIQTDLSRRSERVVESSAA